MAEEEESSCLSLQLKVQQDQSLVECLEKAFMEEEIPLEQKWRCSKCRQVRRGIKQQTMVMCPGLLILHLVRFSFKDGQVHKNESQVGVPETVVVACQKFRLVAVVKHKGSRHSGHYTAEIRYTGGWLLCNDSQISKMRKPSMEWSPDAYLLFYEAVPASDLSVSDTPEKGGPTTALHE